VIVGDEGIERCGAEDDLLAVGPAESGPPAYLGGGRRLGRKIGGQLEERGLVGFRPLALGWSAHKQIVAPDWSGADSSAADSAFIHKL